MRFMLPDILAPNLGVIFCGTAAGNQSAQIGHYYAGRGNKFWRTLHKVGLTDHQIEPTEDISVLEFRIGLMDLAKGVSGMDQDIPAKSFVPARLKEIIAEYRPRNIAFNGKRAAQIALSLKPGVAYGLREPSPFVGIGVWVLPSTSGAANSHWAIEPWHSLAAAVHRGGNASR